MSARPRKRGRRGGPSQAEVAPSVTREELATKTVPELRQMAAELELDVKALKKKDEIISAVYEAKVKAEGFIDIVGILDVLPEGYGFIRTSGYLPGDHDVYCSMSQVRRFELRRGDLIKGQVRPPKESEKYPALLKVGAINGLDPEAAKQRKNFKDLTPVYPDDRLRLEHGPQFMTVRVIDLVAPIGKGQRGLIVSPPKAGKTTVLKDVAAAITENNPEVYLMCLLVDERPEEVTDMERSIHGEVVSSTFDMPSENHIAVAELVMERAKRLVESGYDVVILLDSITRLARAYNLATPASGRILSGGVDSTALYPPKKFFGAARNIEFGGSLTILATALVDTGSKMDEVIFEEFKGTGNMELRLDRGMADRRIFPAIDVVTSGTRKEELILDPMEAPFVWGLRRVLHGVDSPERALDMLIKGLKQTQSNQEFLTKMAKRAEDKRGTNGIDL
ncbi:MAG: transcription termination factor Rho [Actinobacteria bacterium HGW-Actinobacteria-6]|nr:MAG: transcription termination factor Rho [Actinobacteria bacterium HGW-Actinobacteria-6]